MGLISRITEEVRSKSMKKASMIVNGRYLTYKSKLIYVDLTKDNTDVIFYIVEDKDKVYVDAHPLLVTRLNNQDSLGADAHDFQDNDAAAISVNRSLNVIVIESQVYAMLRELTNNPGKTATINGHTLSPTELNSRLSRFRLQGFSNYQNVIYGERSQKIVTRLRNRNSFYKIQNAFVPVFVDCTSIYNPFKDPTYSNIAYTELWKVAEEKGRFVEADGGLSCYMLTHLEICKALGLHNFMRFTPEFLYRFFVGMRLGIDGFPNVTDTVHVKSSQEPSKFGYKRIMDDATWKSKLYELQEMSSDPERATESKDRLLELQEYTDRTSLEQDCVRYHDRLTSYGSSCLDDPADTTVAKLYQYLTQA